MSLRIRAPLPAGDVRRSRGDGAEDLYMSRLVKLVPAEAITIYPALLTQANLLTPADGAGPRYAAYFIGWLMLAAVVALRWRATYEAGKGPQWGAILVAAVAFFLWVHVMPNGDFGFERLLPDTTPDGLTRALPGGTDLKALKEFMASSALAVWTLLAPAVYRGEESN